MLTIKKVEVVIEVPVVEVKAPVRKLRPWVKKAIAGIVLSGALYGVTNIAMAHNDTPDVKWVDAYAHDGDGYERMVRSANPDKDLDIKELSRLMQDKNHEVALKAGVVYKVPVVLEAK